MGVIIILSILYVSFVGLLYAVLRTGQRYDNITFIDHDHPD